MKDTFTIISQLDSPAAWQTHKQQHLQDKLTQLQKTAAQADERNLDTSAMRYRPSKLLLNAINAALAARVPLLLTGEPGTGKTQVAWYIKNYLDIPLYSYQVHSNSQATEMRYDFDAVAYLRDAYLARESNNDTISEDSDPRSNRKYLKPAALWKAYDPDMRHADDKNKSECVLLIDEIDKAPRDFPNDLLQELDQHWFEHPFEENTRVERKVSPPITIITSNGERRLPDAFLRRCMVHNILLDSQLIQDIMQAWDSQFPQLDADVRAMAQRRFESIRENTRLSKRPGTAEFLLWLSVLSAKNTTLQQIDEKTVALDKLPDLFCLIKDHTDYALLKT